MMTGRELIIYILKNNLEDAPIYTDGRLLNLMSLAEAACKYGVGSETVKCWVQKGLLESIEIAGYLYVFDNQPNPKELVK